MKTKNRAVAILFAFLLLVSLAVGCGSEGEPSSSSPPSTPMAAGVPDVLPADASESALPQVPSSSSSGQPPVSSSTPEPQPAPVFLEGGISAVTKDGKVTVTFKTDVAATVNAILSTSSASIGVQTFYDYFNRGSALEGAVSKHTTYRAGPDGGSLTIELPSLDTSYYLLINAVENETGTWQSSVTVLSLLDAGAYAPAFVGEIVQREDKDQSLTFYAQTSLPATVRCLVTALDAAAPTTQQVKDGGSGYGGSVLAIGAGGSTSAAAPYESYIYIPRQSLQTGSYIAWFIAESTVDGRQVLSAAVGKAIFNI